MEASNANLTVDGGVGAEGFGGALYGRMPATVAGIVIALVVIVFAKLTFLTLDPKEPPLIKPKIPIIGHIIGES
jgi:hypothetical protein